MIFTHNRCRGTHNIVVYGESMAWEKMINTSGEYLMIMKKCEGLSRLIHVNE